MSQNTARSITVSNPDVFTYEWALAGDVSHWDVSHWDTYEWAEAGEVSHWDLVSAA